MEFAGRSTTKRKPLKVPRKSKSAMTAFSYYPPRLCQKVNCPSLGRENNWLRWVRYLPVKGTYVWLPQFWLQNKKGNKPRGWICCHASKLFDTVSVMLKPVWNFYLRIPSLEPDFNCEFSSSYLPIPPETLVGQKRTLRRICGMNFPRVKLRLTADASTSCFDRSRLSRRRPFW